MMVDSSLHDNWLRLLEATKQEPFAKNPDCFYEARLCVAADKPKDAFFKLQSHFTQPPQPGCLKMTADLCEVQLLEEVTKRVCRKERDAIH